MATRRQPDRALSVFVLASSLVAPFTISFWARVTEDTLYQQIASTVMYLTGVLALVGWLTWKLARSRRDAAATPSPAKEPTAAAA